MGTKNALKKQIQKTHTTCRRCGRTSFHIQKKVCSALPVGAHAHYKEEEEDFRTPTIYG